MDKKYPYIILGVAVVIIGGAIFLSQGEPPSRRVDGEYSTIDAAGLPIAKQTEIVELKNSDTYDLTAGFVRKDIDGAKYRMLAYNGSIPGPVIKIVQGSEVTIRFKNNTDMKTLLHSHGVRMDNPFDGSQATQKEMEPGETFLYKLKFPDAGVYWYHPHVREDYQQELGLYGNYLVVPAGKDYWAPVNREIPIFLDDILIENGAISPFYKTSANHALMGRYGNVMLTNGETNYALSAKKGEVIRFFVTNASNVRPFNFAIAGVKMKLVGGDSGAYEKDQWSGGVVLGPSERTVIEVLFDKTGSYQMQNQTPDRTYALGEVAVSDESAVPAYGQSFPTLRTHEETVKSIDPFRTYFGKEPDKRIKLSVNMTGTMQNMMSGGGHMMPDGTMMGGGMMVGAPPDGIEWENTMQMMSAPPDTSMVKWKIIDQDTGKENTDIDWNFKVGDKVKIRIFNDPNSGHPMQHPIHFHGQRFLVVDRNGMAQTDLAWKDAVLVPSGQYVDILLDASNPGEWMAHCHIAEHLEAGMMMQFTVR